MCITEIFGIKNDIRKIKGVPRAPSSISTQAMKYAFSLFSLILFASCDEPSKYGDFHHHPTPVTTQQRAYVSWVCEQGDSPVPTSPPSPVSSETLSEDAALGEALESVFGKEDVFSDFAF